MDAAQLIAERKIREALESGMLDHLPGKGRPLVLEDESGVPQELRMAYKVMANAGLVPPELHLRKEILSLQDLVAAARDELERTSLRRQLNIKRLQYQSHLERRLAHAPSAYRGPALERLLHD